MTIAERQNEPRSLDCLAAQRRLYTVAKRAFFIHAIFVGPIAVLGTIIALKHPESKPYFALWGFILTVLDLTIINPWIGRTKEAAAKIQELFDTHTLGLPWNDVKAGKRPDPETVKDSADAHLGIEHYSGQGLTVWGAAAWAWGKCWNLVSFALRILGVCPSKQDQRDWYGSISPDLPEFLNVIICQRSNCSYDQSVRKTYSAVVLVISALAAVTIVALPLAKGFTVQDLVLFSLAPAAPILVFGIRNHREQMQAVARSLKIQDNLEKTWKDALIGGDSPAIRTRIRQIQDEIFDHRKNSPLVLDSVYNFLRGKLEARMATGSFNYAEEAKRFLASKACGTA